MFCKRIIFHFREAVTDVAARLTIPSGHGLNRIVALCAGLLCFVPWGLMDASAQPRTQLPPDCIKYLSYYQEDYKLKDYDRALPNWRKALNFYLPW